MILSKLLRLRPTSIPIHLNGAGFSTFRATPFSPDTRVPDTLASTVVPYSWPNLLFTDDTWSEADESVDEITNNSLASMAWDSPGSEEIPMRIFSTFKLLFIPKHRENLCKVISEELDLSNNQADVYLNFLRIKPIFHPQFLDEARFIRERRNLLRLMKRHLAKSDIIDAFELFALSLRATQYRISFFKECGFKSLKPCHLLNFDKIVSLSEATVKHLRLLDADVSVVDSLLSNCPNLTESSHLRESLTIQGLTLGLQYEKVKLHILNSIANSADIWKNKQSIRYQSINGVHILSNALKNYRLKDSYSPSDLRIFLEVYPNNLKEIITQIPVNFDENTLTILLKYPKVLHTFSSTLTDNLNLLKRHFGFTNAEIDCYPGCLTIETSDLKERINNLYALFGTSSQPRSILSLTHLDMDEISSLLKDMKDNGFSVTDLSSINDYLSVTVKKTKFHPNAIPAHLRGLNRELDVPQSIIMQTLHRHPNFHLMDNHKIKAAYQYIKSLDGITKEQLLNGLNLCLYDIDKIQEALNRIKKRDDFEEWRKHPYFLEALVYTIEKNHSFEDIYINDDHKLTSIESIEFTDDHER